MPAACIAFNITNSYLNLTPLIADLADDAGLVVLVQHDRAGRCGGDVNRQGDVAMGVMARSAEALGPLAHDARWQPVPARSAPMAWTDDFSNPLSLVRWLGN